MTEGTDQLCTSQKSGASFIYIKADKVAGSQPCLSDEISFEIASEEKLVSCGTKQFNFNANLFLCEMRYFCEKDQCKSWGDPLLPLPC